MKTLSERQEIIYGGVRYRARKRFRQENFSNPYGEQSLLEDPLQRGMAIVYDEELAGLLRERMCPCCGQHTRGDLDY